MKVNLQALHEKALKTARNYLKAESELIALLQEIDGCRAYREFGFKSLFEYAAQGLKLSESVSYNLITIARKSREVPQLQAMIQRQEITVSNARMVAPVLTIENQEKWLSAAATYSKRELEREIAKEFPETKARESARYVSEKRLELKVGISEELHETLNRVQDLVSSQSGRALNLEETLRVTLEFYIDKKDPIKKAERAEKRTGEKKSDNAAGSPEVQSSTVENINRVSPVPGQVSYHRNKPDQTSHRKAIPAKLQHAILLRDHSQCSFKTAEGVRCREKRWLDFHHLRPLSQGGQTNLENLALLCRGHHQMIHH